MERAALETEKPKADRKHAPTIPEPSVGQIKPGLTWRFTFSYGKASAK